MNKSRTTLFSFSIFCVLVASGLYPRLYPFFTYIPDQLEEQASLTVIGRLKQHARLTVERQYPRSSDTEKSALSKRVFDDILKEKGPRVRQSIQTLAAKMAREQKLDVPTGGPYLLGSDSYYYYGLLKNIRQTGRMAKTIRGSKYYNPRMLAPLGHWEPFNLHPYVGYIVYRLIRMVSPSVSLMSAAALVPLLIFTLCVAVYILICRRLDFSLWETAVGGLYFVLAPVFLRRSAWGWFDNDPYNILFPLMILFSLIIGLRRLRDNHRWWPSAVAGAVLLATYTLFWQGWVYLLSLVVIAAVLMLMDDALMGAKKWIPWQRHVSFWGLFTASSFGLVALVFGPREFFVLFQEGWQALSHFLSPRLSLWPDLFISVGELKKATPAKIIELTGGPLFTGLMLIGFIATLLRLIRRNPSLQAHRHAYLLLSVFLVFTVYISLGAERFTLLCLIPMGLFFPVGLSTVCLGAVRLKPVDRFLSGRRWAKTAALILISAALVYWPWSRAVTIMRSWKPIYNDTWDTVMQKIDKQTPPDSIISSWWPPGHFITAMTGRRVTFDGATINRPQAYWMANVFLTDNERQAAGILRMLNTSGNQAAETMTAAGMPLSQAVELLKKAVALDKPQARALLSGHLPEPVAEAVLSLTHGQPPPSYILFYNELFDKNLEFSFVGRWNFRTIEQLNARPEKLKKIPPPGSEAYIQFLWSLAGGPLNTGRILAPVGREGSRIIFEEGLVVDMAQKVCRVNSMKFGRGTASMLVYEENGSVMTTEQPGASLPYAVVLFGKTRLPSAVVMDKPLARSLMTKLFLFEGTGLKYFEPVIKERNLTGRTDIRVFRVRWDNLP